MSYKIKAQGTHSLRRKKTAKYRDVGDPSDWMFGDHKSKKFYCSACGTEMEYWKTDVNKDWIYSCKNQFCFKSKDFAGGLTTTLKKLTKQLQTNANLFYRTYDGRYK